MHDDLPIDIRPLRESDVEDLPAFLERVFGTWPSIDVPVSPLEHLRWKLAGGGAPWPHRVAMAGGRIAGLSCYWTSTVRVAGRRLRGATGVDMGVDPDFRDRHVFSRIAGAGQAFDIQFSQTASEAAARGWVHALGGRAFGARVEVLSMRLQPGRWLPRPAHRRRTSDVSGVAVLTAAAFDARVDTLWHGAAPQFDFIVERSAERMNWRHADSRGGRSTIVLATGETHALVGYCVLREHGNAGHIADLLVEPGRLDVVHLLLTDAAQRAAAAGLRSLRAWSPAGHPYRAVLLEQGFHPTGRTIRLMFNRLAAPEGSLDILESPDVRLHIMSGDMDLV